MSKVVGETEHLKEMLVGNILSVSWHELARTAALFALRRRVPLRVRKKFLLISMDEPEAERRGLSIRLWDFLFYGSFGLVVTLAVPIAGVLLVFSYLIVPAVSAMLFSTRLGVRLAIGWTMGALTSAIGVYLSYLWDLPTGATIVTTLGAGLLLLAGVRVLVRRGARADAAAERAA
jgi:zinc/manganese transport system permease protein